MFTGQGWSCAGDRIMEPALRQPAIPWQSLELWREACFFYRKRFSIETFFSDQKSRWSAPLDVIQGALAPAREKREGPDEHPDEQIVCRKPARARSRRSSRFVPEWCLSWRKKFGYSGSKSWKKENARLKTERGSGSGLPKRWPPQNVGHLVQRGSQRLAWLRGSISFDGALSGGAGADETALVERLREFARKRRRLGIAWRTRRCVVVLVNHKRIIACGSVRGLGASATKSQATVSPPRAVTADAPNAVWCLDFAD